MKVPIFLLGLLFLLGIACSASNKPNLDGDKFVWNQGGFQTQVEFGKTQDGDCEVKGNWFLGIQGSGASRDKFKGECTEDKLRAFFRLFSDGMPPEVKDIVKKAFETFLAGS